MGIQHVTGDSFKAEVITAPLPVLVDFWAEWCGPCRMLAPVLEELAVEYDDRLKVAKLNVDQNQDLAMQYGVMSIPTMVLFREGREVDRLVGYLPKNNLKARLDQALAG